MRSISASFRRIHRQPCKLRSLLTRRLKATTTTSCKATSAVAKPTLVNRTPTVSKYTIAAVNVATKLESWKPAVLACAAVAAVATAGVVYIDCVAEEMQARDVVQVLTDGGMVHARLAHHARAEKHDLHEEQVHLQKLVQWTRLLDSTNYTHLKAVAATLLVLDSNRVSNRLYEGDGEVNRGDVVSMRSPILDVLFGLTGSIEPETLSKLDQLLRRLNAAHHFASAPVVAQPTSSTVSITGTTSKISNDEAHYNKYLKAFKSHCKFCGLYGDDPREELHFHENYPMCMNDKPVSAQEFVANLVYDELDVAKTEAHKQILAKTGISITNLFTGFRYHHGWYVPEARYELQKLKLSNPIDYMKTHPYLLIVCGKPTFANCFSGEYARVVDDIDGEDTDTPPTSDGGTPPSTTTEATNTAPPSTSSTNIKNCRAESPTLVTTASRENVVYKGLGAYHTIA